MIHEIIGNPIGKKNQLRSLNGMALAVGSVIVLAGCGGSSSSSSSTDSSAAFAGKAEAICSQINGQVAALPAITTNASLLSTGQQEITLSRGAIGKLKALTAPAAKKTEFTAYVSGLTQETALLQQALAAIKAGDRAKLVALSGRSKTLDTSNQATAKRLGLTACTLSAQPGSANSSSTSS